MSFDRIARHYRWLEAVLAGDVLQRCRTAFMDRALPVDSALLLGEGNGRFLGSFLEANQSARVVCVEQSWQMILRARRMLERRGINADRVEFIHEDVFKWEPPAAKFDLIVTHFFLDCFTAAQLQHLVPRLAFSGQPACTWLLADFQLPPKGLRRLRAQAIHTMMYAFFRLATDLPGRRVTEPDSLLRESGFYLAGRITAQWGLLRSDCWMRREKGTPDEAV